MAQDERLRIVIEALNKAKAELKGLQNDLDGVESKGKSASTGLGGVKTALAAVGGVYALKRIADTVIELGELGAAAERAETTLVNVAGGAMQASEMLHSVQEATNYTVSEMEAMEAASTFLSLGLADSSDELGEMVRNVSALGERFGGTMQQFQLMMSNKSLARVDSFGLGVEEVARRIEEYEAAGKSANEAFDLAVLDAMNAKFAELGGTLDDDVTKMKQADAATADLSAELGRLFTGIAGGAKRALTPFNRQMTKSLKVLNNASDSTDKWRFWIAFVSQDIEGMRAALGRMENAQEDANEEIENATRIQGDYADAMMDITMRTGESADALGGWSDAATDAITATQDLIDKGAELAETQARNRERNILLESSQSGLTDGLEDNQQSLEELLAESEDYQKQLADLNGEHGRTITVQNKSALSTHELAIAQMDLNAAREKMAEADPGSRAYHVAAQKVTDLQGKIGGATGATQAYIDKSDEISEVEAAYDEVQGKIQGVIDKTMDSVEAFVAQQLQARLAQDGWTEAENELMTTFLEERGLIDENAAHLMRTTDEVARAVEAGTMTAGEAMRILHGEINDTAEEYVGLGSAGQESLSEIIASGDATVEKLEAIGLSAQNAQRMIDQMHGKEIDIDVNFNMPSAVTIPGSGGETVETPGGDYAFAEGGYLPPGRVGKVGEAGMIESIFAVPGGGVQVTPTNQPAQGGGGTTILAPIFLNSRDYQNGAGEWDYSAISSRLQSAIGDQPL